MSHAIRADVFVQKEMAARGITEKTGVFGEHKVKFGNGSPINLKEIKATKVPFAGFRTATKIARGQEGVKNCAADAMKVLSSRTGTLDAKSLLGSLKAAQIHLDRLDKLGQLTPAQKKDSKWLFTNAIQNMSNAELSTTFQSLTTPEMDLLQAALIREASILRDGKKDAPLSDADKAINMLFNLQAMVLKEVSNRSAVSKLNDLKAANPNDQRLNDLQNIKSLTARYGGEVTPLKTTQDKNDISASNLVALAETSAQSAINREQIVHTEQNKLTARNIDNVSVKEMADVLRSAELTVNINLDVLLGDSSIIAHPDKPMSNIFHLEEQNIKPKGDGYLEKRDNVEQLLFPELQGHQRKADERPIYGALNIMQRKIGALTMNAGYGSAAIVLKPSVAKRATYIADDTFYAPKFTISPERRENFYKLLASDKNLPQGLKEALNNVDSQERKDMEQWLDGLAQQENKSILYFKNNTYPLSVRNILSGGVEDEQAQESMHEFFQSLLIKSFGDATETRKVMATHDNLESLIPTLGDINSNALANAAINKRNGLDAKCSLSGINYIEAQIQGSLIPNRDIAEIRIDLNDVSKDKHAALREQMKNFTRQTGIPVKLIKVDKGKEDELEELAVSNQEQFNMEHLDKKALEQAKNDVLENLEQHVHDFIKSYGNLDTGLPEGMLKLEGNSLNKLAGKFGNELDKLLENPEQAGRKSISDLINTAFEKVAVPILEQKAQLLAEVEKLQFDTPAQKTAFVSWVRSAAALRSPEEVRIIHNNAQIQAKALQGIATADPALGATEIYKLMSDLTQKSSNDLNAFLSGVGANGEIGAEDKLTELNRISFMGLAMLQNGDPHLDQEALQRLYDRINTQEMQAMCGQIEAISHDDALMNTQDFGLLYSTRDQLVCHLDNLANLTNQHFSPLDFNGNLSQIPESLRQVLRTTTPQLAQQLDTLYPVAS